MKRSAANPILKLFAAGIMLFAGVVSCAKEKGEDEKPPIVSFDNPTGIYIVKAGKQITIEPNIENDLDGKYSWTSEGRVLATGKIFTGSWDESGQVYLTFEVRTVYGEDSGEVRVDVAALVPPVISLAVPEGGYEIATGQKLELIPEVAGGDGNSYLWTVNSEKAADTKNHTFTSEETGTFRLALAASNEDGEDMLEFDVNVKDASQMEFSWAFESLEYNVSEGRRIRLLPFSIQNQFDAEYIWTVDGEEVQKSGNPLYAFQARTRGTYAVTVTMRNSFHIIIQELTVNVCPPEGTYKRPASALSSEDWNKVYEFTAAPGQLINEDYTAATMEEAVAYAEERLSKELYVSLGAFGGYIVLGFDHSIENDGGYNLRITGNSTEESSEPGIVWVMQDENGDGIPNDTWYELKGSEYGKPETVQDYEITYFKPSAPKMPVSWTDNLGGSGTVDYLASFHRQDYYYPLWIGAASYTLRGTRLQDRTREVSSGNWVNGKFDWGYADNFSPTDRLTDDDNPAAGVNANHFKISAAVTFEGEPADLAYIDFIKIQTGVNAKAGWLGEVSTEVFGAKDFNMGKNK